jgi:hypothetical protein
VSTASVIRFYPGRVTGRKPHTRISEPARFRNITIVIHLEPTTYRTHCRKTSPPPATMRPKESAMAESPFCPPSQRLPPAPTAANLATCGVHRSRQEEVQRVRRIQVGRDHGPVRVAGAMSGEPPCFAAPDRRKQEKKSPDRTKRASRKMKNTGRINKTAQRVNAPFCAKIENNENAERSEPNLRKLRRTMSKSYPCSQPHRRLNFFQLQATIAAIRSQHALFFQPHWRGPNDDERLRTLTNRVGGHTRFL